MKVVVALDDSPYSQHMLDLICRRHWAVDTSFKIVHVIEPISSADWAGDGWMEMHEELCKRRHNWAEKLCSEARLKLEKHVPGSIVHYEVREGSPKSEIVYAAAAWDANKIIVGAQSRDVCPHNMLGSVSRAVTEHAPCTVEIVRSNVAHAHTGKHPASAGAK